MVRLVDTDLARPQLTAAIDETLLLSRMAGRSGDTVHLYRRRPPSVSIGYFQSAAQVADLGACRAEGIPVVRRISAGGAIYTDERQLVYALSHDPPKPLRAQEGLDLACDAIVRTLARLGVEDARRQGMNDVVVGSLKVSGSAQAIRRGVHLVHGTVLVDVDRSAMVRYLRPGQREGADGVRTTPGGRVTTLAEVLGAPPPIHTIKSILAEELALGMGGVVEPGDLDAWERAESARLEKERYGNDEWNLRR